MSAFFDTSVLSDLFKTANGFRPPAMFWQEWHTADDRVKRGIWNYWVEAANNAVEAERAEAEAAMHDFANTLAAYMANGAPNKWTAYRWLCDAHGYPVRLDEEADYRFGLPYGTLRRIFNAR